MKVEKLKLMNLVLKKLKINSLAAFEKKNPAQC